MQFFGFGGVWPTDMAATQQSGSADSARLSSFKFGSQGVGGVLASQTAAEHGLVIALRGNPIWHQPASLPSEHRAPGADIAVLILRAYIAKGPSVIGQLAGSFALAILDTNRGQALLAIDRMGIERLAYAITKDGLLFSDSAIDIARHPAVNAAIRSQAFYDFLLLHMVPAPDSVFQGVQKLRPGNLLTFDLSATGVRHSITRYWKPEFSEDRTARFEQLQESLHSSLADAVRRCQPTTQTGAFLSGGLDSSSVAGMLARVTERPSKMFSAGFGVESYDELRYARIANRHFGHQGIEIEVVPEDIVSIFPKIAASFDEPFGNSSAVPTYVCAKTAAEHGIDHLLAGDGGDEIFGGNDRYVRQSVFETYLSIPALLRRTMIEPLVGLIDAESPLTPLRKLRSYVDQARITLPERLETWNLVYRTGAQRVLHSELFAAIDTDAPLRTMREVFDLAGDSTTLNKLLMYDWHYTLSDNDLRKVGKMCELAGVRVSYPMIDNAVIDVSLRVPTHMKIKRGELRWFYKRAMENFLPQEIITKTKHGFGLPFGVWLKSHAKLNELVLGHLDSLRSRRIVNAAFVDDIASQHRTGDASFYGYPIWDLAMLDAWLTAHNVRL